MKYIVSIVMGKTIPGAVGYDAQGRIVQAAPDISIQNEVSILTAASPEEAYEKSASLAKLKHPDHNVVVRVIIAANEEDLKDG